MSREYRIINSKCIQLSKMPETINSAPAYLNRLLFFFFNLAWFITNSKFLYLIYIHNFFLYKIPVLA